MECSACKGLKIIHVRAVPGVHQQYDVECPACGGTGELPDTAELPNHCLICGEPVPAPSRWCDLPESLHRKLLMLAARNRRKKVDQSADATGGWAQGC